MRKSALLIALTVLLALTARQNAGGAELLANGGFEDGTAAWSTQRGTLDAVDEPVHGGELAARFHGSASASDEVYQSIPITTEGIYELSGWVLLDDPDVERVQLRIVWYDADGDFLLINTSESLTTTSSSFRRLTTGMEASPQNAVSARVGVVVVPNGEFSIYLDDLSFDGPEPVPSPSPSPSPEPTPTPSPTPTPTPAPTATPTPTPAPTPSPTPSLTPTPAPTPATSTPTSVPSPTATVTPTPTPDATGSPATPSPSVSPAPTALPATPTPGGPVVTPSPAVTPAPTPAPTLSPNPPATASPTATPAEPDVFPSLVNGGFEIGRGDGTPYGWRKFGGDYSLAPHPDATGGSVLRFASSTSSTKWVYQTLSVKGGSFYEATVRALKDDPNVDAVFIRISFYASEDGSGQAIESTDSPLLTDGGQEFVRLSTGAVRASDGARSVRLRLMLRPRSEEPAIAYFDDATFGLTAPPTSTPAPPVSPSPEATATPTPGVSPEPTAASVSATPLAEPAVFAAITNASFEEQRPDGTPSGWRKIGGSISADGAAAVHGARSLVLTSETASTKWAYQNVYVEPGVYYSGSVYAMPVAASEAFLRISWYASEDGSGQAISSDDSTESVTGPASEFVRVTTGPVRAPSEARSAKVKLMLRPGTDSAVVARFDLVTFEQAPAPHLATSGELDAGADTPSPASEPDSVEDRGGDGGGDGQAALGAARTPVQIANVGPSPAAVDTLSSSQSGGRDYWWLVFAISVATPLAGFAVLAAYEIRRKRLDGGDEAET